MTEKTQPLVSLIIRTKNEERWIAACLRKVCSQTYANFEIIIVDNGSTDRTLKRASEFPVKVIHIDQFLPGLAINEGIRASKGELLVCLSGHCIPVNDTWLENLLKDLIDADVAGVYGRQEPLSYTSDFDKRDLITVFGLDKKIQVKDSFFHNANSAFRREIWEQFPFDEQVTNIEDRVWGQQVISAGMKIVYEPEASVYHWHGIHQDLNPERARKVVRILESLHGLVPRVNHVDPAELKTLAVIPIRGKSRLINSSSLLQYTITAARNASYITDVLVATDDTETADLARSLGARVPFLRPKELSEDYVDVLDVVSYVLDRVESTEGVPDLVVILEETYPFRTAESLDAMIVQLVNDGLDTVVAAHKETRGIWLKTEQDTNLLAEGFMPRKLKQSHAMVGLVGYGCVTHPMFLRQGDLMSGKVGIFEVEHPLSSIEVRDETTILLANKLLDHWLMSRTNDNTGG